MKTAAIVIVGNEILSGQVADENARFLIEKLRELGVSLGRIMVVPDDIEAIAEVVRDLSPRFDWVFTSGGVGPTHDDVTIEGVARGLGRRVVRDPSVEALLRAHYGPDLPEASLRMADVPEGSERAGGDDLRWPVCVAGNVYVLPGVPEIFRRKFTAVCERFRQPPFVLRSVYLRTDESRIAAILADLAVAFSDVQVGSYPRPDEGGGLVRVTFESKDGDAVDRAAGRLLERVPAGMLVRTE